MTDVAGWRGIFAIPVTPFLPTGELDMASLERQVEFCIDAGAHGLVYPAVVSEFFTLTDSERRSATSAVLEVARGRVPVVIGVSATSTMDAAELAEHAASLEASGVMAMLPYVDHFFAPDLRFVLDHFTAIGRAGLPIVLQNARMGHPVGVDVVRRVLSAVPEVQYLKQETSPCTHELSTAVQGVGGQVKGVFGGLGGVYLLNEIDRGACGSMPAPGLVDVLRRAWDHNETGDRQAARDVLLPFGGLFNLELLYNLALIKEILFRRGVIDHIVSRVPVPRLDGVDHRELDDLLAGVDLASWPAPMGAV